MKKFVNVEGENTWKCCECETEYSWPKLEEIDKINEVDYDFGDEILTVLVCNECMYELDPKLLKEIR